MLKKSNNINLIASLNIISTFILQGIAFLSTPIFTRMLGASQYGQYAVFNSWVMIGTCFMGLSMHSSIGTGLYHFSDQYLNFRNSILLFSTIICVLEAIIIAAMGAVVSKYSNISVWYIILVVSLSFSHYIVNFAQTSFIYEKKAWNNFGLSVIISILTTGLSIFFIWNMVDYDKYLGRIYGVVIPYGIIAALVWIYLFFSNPAGLKKNYCEYAFRVGFPIIFHSLSQNILSQSDRVMMQFMKISNSEIGIYSLFYTLTSVLTVILNALNNTWCPFYYDDLSRSDWGIIRKKSKNYMELFSILTFGFLMLSPEVLYVMADRSYSSGINTIPILTCSVYFTFMYQFPVNYEFFNRKTRIIALGTVGAGIVNIILNFILIPLSGMFGAGLATCLSYMSLFIAHFYIVTHSQEFEGYGLKIQVFIPGIVFVFVGVCLFYIFSSYWAIRWSIGTFLGIFELCRILRRKSIF
ncbi:MAG: oligosaccharide flippase family protein [Hungatella sp.]|nr:oligosaccharide flippase family protein [Hungatella sp.]